MAYFVHWKHFTRTQGNRQAGLRPQHSAELLKTFCAFFFCSPIPPPYHTSFLPQILSHPCRSNTTVGQTEHSSFSLFLDLTLHNIRLSSTSVKRLPPHFSPFDNGHYFCSLENVK